MAQQSQTADELRDTLTADWTVEAAGDTAAYAYSDNPETTPQEELTVLEVRHRDNWTVSARVWNDGRGMADVAEYTETDTATAAVSAAADFAASY